jgi:hypothetical protein
MDLRKLASTHALGRIGFGAAMLLAPGTIGRAWVGRDGARPGTRVITSGMGARDAALGLGLADALRSGRDPGPWLFVAALADAADLLSMFRARDTISTPAFVGVGALAGGSALFGLYLGRAVGQAAP